MTLTWGKPLLEIAPYVNGALPATPTWTPIDTPKEDSTQLTTTKGTQLKATLEGGETVDTKNGKNSYALAFELQVKRGDDKPIEDVDGVVEDNYAIRLTPEDDTLAGYIIEKSSVSVEETFTSKDGSIWKYTFDALKPATGAMLKPYTKV